MREADLGLLVINPANLKVQLAVTLRNGSYGDLHNRTLVVPEMVSDKPDKDALTEHRRLASLTQRFD